MNQILYAGKQKLAKCVIGIFVGALWIFSITLIINSINNAINANKYKWTKKPDIVVVFEDQEIEDENVETSPNIGEQTQPGESTGNPAVSPEQDNPQTPTEVTTDTTNPILEVTKIDDNKLNIKATDDVKMDYITYSWNNGPAEKVDVSSGDVKTISIPVGNNSIVVKAYDSAGNVASYTGDYTVEEKIENIVTPSDPTSETTKDVNAPNIYIGKGNPVSITVQDDIELASVEYTLNGKVRTIDVTSSTKSINFKITLQSGTNTLNIVAIDKAGNRNEIAKTIEI